MHATPVGGGGNHTCAPLSPPPPPALHALPICLYEPVCDIGARSGRMRSGGQQQQPLVLVLLLLLFRTKYPATAAEIDLRYKVTFSPHCDLQYHTE